MITLFGRIKRKGFWMAPFALAVIAPAIHGQPSANVSVFATGLDGPRGLKFGPDGIFTWRKLEAGGPSPRWAFASRYRRR